MAALSSAAQSNLGVDFWGIDRRNGGGLGYAVAVVNPDASLVAHVTVLDQNGPAGAADVAPLSIAVIVLGHRSVFPPTFPWRTTSAAPTVRVVSDIPVAAFQSDAWEPSVSSDASLLVPSEALGTDYIVAAWGQPPGAGERFPLYRPHVDIVATSPGFTTYSIVDATGAPIETGTLEPFEARIVYGAGTEEAAGWRITADQPVAVFSGNEYLPIGNDCCSDALEEQLWPSACLGVDHVVSPLRAFPITGTEKAKDAFLVIATASGTEITTTPDVGHGRLDAGERLTIVTDVPFVLHASQPIQLAQFLASDHATAILGVPTATPGIGDPSMILVPDVTRFSTDAWFATIDADGVDGVDVLSILARRDAVLELDGAPIAPACEPAGTLGGSAWCHHLVGLGQGAHHLASDIPAWAMYVHAQVDGSQAFPAAMTCSPPVAATLLRKEGFPLENRCPDFPTRCGCEVGPRLDPVSDDCTLTGTCTRLGSTTWSVPNDLARHVPLVFYELLGAGCVRAGDPTRFAVEKSSADVVIRLVP